MSSFSRPNPLPVANGGTGDTGTGWTSYVPAVTALLDTFGSATGAGRYKVQGKTVDVQFAATITTFGSGTYPRVALPAGMTAAAAKFTGTAGRSNGTAWQAEIGSGSNFIQLRGANNEGGGSDGDVFTGTIRFELA